MYHVLLKENKCSQQDFNSDYEKDWEPIKVPLSTLSLVIIVDVVFIYGVATVLLQAVNRVSGEKNGYEDEIKITFLRVETL